MARPPVSVEIPSLGSEPGAELNPSPSWRVHDGSRNDLNRPPTDNRYLGKPNTTFGKRQREQKKREKRAEKARRKAEREAAKKLGPAGEPETEGPAQDSEAPAERPD